jgi:hypothetical protein
MNAPKRSEVLREMDPVREHRAHPGVHTVPREHRSDGQTPPRNPGGTYAPDEGTFETFADGAGI